MNEHDQIVGSIGGVIDESSRVGKEIKIAMKMAAQDFRRSTCSKLALHLRDSNGHSAHVATAGHFHYPSLVFLMKTMQNTNVSALCVSCYLLGCCLKINRVRLF